jgi:hypothetical protein
VSVTAEAGWGHRAHQQARTFSQGTSWNGNYYHPAYGEPIALVVPPTADSMSAWSWGVAQSEVRPLYHQFGRAYVPGGASMSVGNPYTPTPRWPSHTDNFGIYPVRAPWR